MKFGEKKRHALQSKPAAKPRLKKASFFSISAYYAQRGRVDTPRGIFRAMAASLKGNNAFAAKTAGAFGKVISSLF